MHDNRIEQLKAFLIRRLIAVITAVAAAEALIILPVRYLILPAAAHIAGLGSLSAGSAAGGLFGIRDLPELIFTLLGALLSSITGGGLFGGGQSTLYGIACRSGAFLILLLGLIALLLPPVLGILFYAWSAASRMNELQTERENELKAAEAQRSLMLSDMAHDLKTPIMTISGYARALNDGLVKDDATRRSYLETIEKRSVKMAELIDLMFEYTKLDSADFRLDLQTCDINVLTAECAAAYYTEIEEAGMELEADIPETPFTVQADPAHTARVFNNLLINAVRHNPTGTRILVAVRRLAGAEYIAVADTGVSIEKDPESLFTPFVKGDDSRKSSGSGLGLSIAAKIAEMHGWSLTLSQPCGGTVLPDFPELAAYTKAFILKVTEDSAPSA